MFVNVKIDSEDMLNLLAGRADVWNTWGEDWVYDLWRQYYANQITNGRFDNCEWDVKSIVDNDNAILKSYESIDEAKSAYSSWNSSWDNRRIVAQLDSGEVLVNEEYDFC